MRISDQYIARRIVGQPMLIPVGQKVVEQEEILNLTEPAFFLFEQIEQGRKRSEIVDAYMQHAGYPEEKKKETEQNINSFLRSMKEKQVII